jgi:hypothetical protein
MRAVRAAASGPGVKKSSPQHAVAACFCSPVTFKYNFYFSDCKKKARVLHCYSDEFERATTTDEVKL